MKIVPSELIEPIILKLFYTDSKYAVMLGDVFEKEWFKDEGIGECIQLVIKFYKAKMKLPKPKYMEMIIMKYFKDEDDRQEVLTQFKSTYNINLELYDREDLDEEVVLYLKNGGLCWTIMNNIDEISKSHSVANLIERLGFISAMNFDVDLGMDYLVDHEKHRDKLKEPESRVSIGWDEVNYKMGGGMYKDGRCLILFMGQTHIGKSLFLSNIAANMLKEDKFVVIITLEMCEEVYATRIDAHLSELDINSLKNQTDELGSVIDNIAEDCNGKILIKEYAPGSASCTTIKTYLERVIQTYDRKPDAILIDYLSLLKPSNGHFKDNSDTMYDKVSMEMRQLSYIFKTPVISVVQSNRDGFDNCDPKMQEIGKSISITQNADFIGAIYQNEGDKEAGLIYVSILKNRLGGFVGSTLKFEINYNNLKIIDIKRAVTDGDTVADEIIDEVDDIDDV
jgi:archaellum biogenesis ATPase FlaH